MSVTKITTPFRYTRVPTNVIDDWTAVLTGAELKVYLVIARLTWGWGKREDTIAIPQIMQRTGLSRSGAKKAISGLAGRGLLRVSGPGRSVQTYEILTRRGPGFLAKNEPPSGSPQWPSKSESGSLQWPHLGHPSDHSIDNRYKNRVYDANSAPPKRGA